MQTHRSVKGLFRYYEEDSKCLYFNPCSFEASSQYFLVGVVFGLAVSTLTILDVALPSFLFRKLLSAAPVPAGKTKPIVTYTLGDLAEYRPWLARGLRQLLEFDGDVESTFDLVFAIDEPKYDSTEHIPLCEDGDSLPVTNANRREYVDLYVRYLLEDAVSRQFDPFQRGFFTVYRGNALSLFRAEEIELLVRGSDQPLDIALLRSAATYDDSGSVSPARVKETIEWFWQTFESATPEDQRKLLQFITGSDRIPALGAATLKIRISCYGDDCDRYPTAQTCFNKLGLWCYATRERLEAMLWTAVRESEGFGLR